MISLFLYLKMALLSLSLITDMTIDKVTVIVAINATPITPYLLLAMITNGP